MNSLTANRFNVGMIALVLLATAVALLSGVVSTRALENDGRLNLVHNMGGDAVFCVDANMIASDSFANGGIRLLSQSGQQLFLVPAAVINAVPEMPLVDTRIAAGPGSHGAVELWRLTNGQFSMIGHDEHGKQFVFQWSGCQQVGTHAEPTVEAPSIIVTEDPCEEPVYNDIILLATPEVDECWDDEYEYPR